MQNISKPFVIIFLFILLLSSCAPSPESLAAQTSTAQTAQAAAWTATATATATATNTLTPTATSTPTPTATMTPTLTPTIKLPAQENTPIPLSEEVITAKNAVETKTLAIWGKGFINQAFYFPAFNRLVVIGGQIYIYETDNFHELSSTIIPHDNTEAVMDVVMSDPTHVNILIKTSENGVLSSEQREGALVVWDIETNIIEEKQTYRNLPCWLNWDTRLSPNGEQFFCTEGYSKYFLVSTDQPDEFYELQNPNIGVVYYPSSVFTSNGEKLFLFSMGSDYDSTYRKFLIWDVASSDIITSGSITAQKYTINDDGHLLALWDDASKVIRVYHIDPFEEISSFSVNSANIETLNISNQGDQIVVSSIEGIVSVWGINSGELISVFDDLAWDEEDWQQVIFVPGVIDTVPFQYLRFNQLEEVIFSADDRSIIAVSKNHRFTRWSLSENQIIKQTPIEAHIFTPPVFINGNQDFAVGDETGQLQIWNIQTHQLLQEFQHDKRILWLISDPDNNRIIFGDGYQEYSLDLSTYEILPLSAYQLSEAILNPDKTKIAGYKSGIVLLINSENMTDHCQIPSNKNQLMLFSPTGNQLVLSNGYTATIWNVSECNQIASLNLGVDIQNKSMSFSENGDHFMITKLDHWPYGHPLIQTWETAHWTLVEEKVFDQEAFGVGQFCFCGNYVLLSEGLYKIGEWDSPVDKYNPAYLPLTDCNQELIFSETGWGFFALIGVR